MKFYSYLAALFAILIWGITFANTRSLLGDFSALEILVVRFALAWAALAVVAVFEHAAGMSRPRRGWRDEWLFVAMGFTGVFFYQFMENCAIYYTNASNVAILVSLDSAANLKRFANGLNWLNLGFLGLLASAASFAMWSFACREIGVVTTTIGLYFTPIVGVIFAALFLGERLTTMSITGGCIIVIGVVIANWRKGQYPKAKVAGCVVTGQASLGLPECEWIWYNSAEFFPTKKEGDKNMAHKIAADKCVACGCCKDACPAEAISEGAPYVIDADKCVDCGACAAQCPNEAIAQA